MICVSGVLINKLAGVFHVKTGIHLAISFVANTLVFIGHPDIIFSGSVFLAVYRSTVAIARVLLALALVLSGLRQQLPTLGC